MNASPVDYGESPVVRVSVVAAALDVTPWCVYDRIRRGLIPSVAVGRAKRVPRWWLDDLLAQAARPEEVAS